MTRPSWPEYALALARTAATRSEDPYVKNGAVVLGHENQVLAAGYNGAPAGIDLDWSDRDARRLWVIHAEANALRYIKPHEAKMLVATMMPCIECLKLTRSYGITQVYYGSELTENYNSAQVHQIADDFGMKLTRVG